MYVEYIQEDGSTTCIYTSAATSTSMTDDELDTIVLMHSPHLVAG